MPTLPNTAYSYWKPALASIALALLASCGGGTDAGMTSAQSDALVADNEAQSTPKAMIDPKLATPAARYFGYALVDCGYDDPNDSSTKTNYVTEVAAFSNLGQMCVFAPTDNIIERLNLMSRNSMQAMLSVQAIFFAGVADAGTGSGLRFTLRPDYATRWASFMQTNKLAQNISKVGAFYVVDEPVWNGVSFQDLKTASDAIKASFPTVVTAIVEAAPALANLKVPTSIDVIGFDHYAIPDPQTDLVFQNELAILKSKRSAPWQKIMLVMDAQWLPFYGEAGYPESYMANVATSYYNIAKADPEIIAILGYTWPGGFGSPGQKGTRNLPQNVIDEHKRIGKIMTGK